MATFSKKTYVLVAETLKAAKVECRSSLADQFAAKFAADNDRFDRDIFYKAIFGKAN